MSANMLGTEHVDFLVTAGIRLAVPPRGPMRWIGPAQEPDGTRQAGQPWGPQAETFLREHVRTLEIGNASKVGQMLLSENMRSVNFRYAESEIEPLYEFSQSRVPVEPVQVLKAIDCYEYQACEHAGWSGSEAQAFCAALRREYVRKLPGYGEALWEVDMVAVDRKRAEEAAKAEAAKARAQSLARLAAVGGRNEVMKAIKAALEKRSGKKWSVTGGRGTGWGWLTIDAPPSRRTWHFVGTGRKDEKGDEIFDEVNDASRQFGHAGPEDRAELGKLLGLEKPVHMQGESVESDHDAWAEYLDRAEGRKPGTFAKHNWD